MVGGVVVVLLGGVQCVHQRATCDTMKGASPWLQKLTASSSLVLAADDNIVSWGSKKNKNGEQSHQLAPHTARRSSNWGSAGIHMSGLTGGLLVSPQHLNPGDLSHMATEQDVMLSMEQWWGKWMNLSILVIESV